MYCLCTCQASCLKLFKSWHHQAVAVIVLLRRKPVCSNFIHSRIKKTKLLYNLTCFSLHCAAFVLNFWRLVQWTVDVIYSTMILFLWAEIILLVSCVYTSSNIISLKTIFTIYYRRNCEWFETWDPHGKYILHNT